MPQETLDFATKGFGSATERFLKDLAPIREEDLARCWGDSERCAYDFIYETALVNGRVSTQLRGEDPGPLPWDFGKNFLKAPEEFRSKDAITKYFEETASSVKTAAAEAGADPFQVVKSVSFATMHTMYHDGQLNFIQALTGDQEVHW